MATLVVHSEYQGPGKVHMNNGTCLPIHSTGSLFCYPASSFVLKNLLHVSGITKNFLPTSQFTVDNKVLEFYPDSCLVSDPPSGKFCCEDNLKMAYISSLWRTIASPPLLRLFSVSMHILSSGTSAQAIPSPKSSPVSYLNIGFLSLLIMSVHISASPVWKGKVTVYPFRHLPRLLLLL